MTPTEFAIVVAALRIGLGNIGERRSPFRHQVERLERHLNEAGDQDQARRLRAMLDPPPDPHGEGLRVQSDRTESTQTRPLEDEHQRAIDRLNEALWAMRAAREIYDERRVDLASIARRYYAANPDLPVPESMYG